MAVSLYKCFRRCLHTILWIFRMWVVLFCSLGLIPLTQHGRCPNENYEPIEGTSLLKLRNNQELDQLSIYSYYY